jgi:hypothetical protein
MAEVFKPLDEAVDPLHQKIEATIKSDAGSL